MGNQITKRQKEVMNLVKLGCTNKNIGLRLGISENTIKSILADPQYGIYVRLGITGGAGVKFGLTERVYAVYICLRDGIIDFD